MFAGDGNGKPGLLHYGYNDKFLGKGWTKRSFNR